MHLLGRRGGTIDVKLTEGHEIRTVRSLGDACRGSRGSSKRIIVIKRWCSTNSATLARSAEFHVLWLLDMSEGKQYI